MKNVNVELKAVDPDPQATVARCLALGATDRGELRQTDTYFLARRGRLKLRTDESAAELIAYRRRDHPEATESAYVLAPVSEPAAVAEALDAAAGDDGRRVQAPAAVSVGGSADPPRRGRRARQLCGVRGGAA